MNADHAVEERRPTRRGMFVQSLLWIAFLFFTTTLLLEWTVVFFPNNALQNPHTDFLEYFRNLRIVALEQLTFVVPHHVIEYVGVVFSLAGLCIALMVISARQTTTANQSSQAPASHDSFGTLTLLEVWIGIMVVVALWMLAMDTVDLGVSSGSWDPLILPATLSGGLVLTAWFAAYVDISPLRLNPLRWILAGLAASYGMTLL